MLFFFWFVVVIHTSVTVSYSAGAFLFVRHAFHMYQGDGDLFLTSKFLVYIGIVYPYFAIVLVVTFAIIEGLRTRVA